MITEVDETPAMIGDDGGGEIGQDGVPEISGAGAAANTRS
jgi:hypothetical protein